MTDRLIANLNAVLEYRTASRPSYCSHNGQTYRTFPTTRSVYVYQTSRGLVYTTSPEQTGISWNIGGPFQTLAEIEVDLPDRDQSVPVIIHPPGDTFQIAEVEFQTRRGERRFWVAMAHTGGVAALANARAGRRVCDDTPLPGPIPTIPPEPGESRMACL